MGHLDEILTEVAKLGAPVDEAFAPVRAHRARADALATALESARRAGERAYGELVRGLSEGKLQPADVPAAVAEASQWAFDSLSARAVVQAGAAAARMADAAAREAGPRAFAALQEQVAGIVAESVRLAGTLPATITSESLMVRSGDETAAVTWLRLRRLIAQWDACHAMGWLIQVRGQLLGEVDAADPGVAACGPYMKYFAPEKLPRNYGQVAGELKLARAAVAGAQPNLYEVTESARRARAAGLRAGKVMAYEPMSVLQVNNSHGFPVPA
jgi:hypothetical protein